MYSIKDEKDITHEAFATVLTKSQVEDRPVAEEAIKAEIQKFKDFKAFTKVSDQGPFAIKTR